MNTHAQKDARSLFKREQCEFEDPREESVLNHTIEKHSTHLCEFCDFTTSDETNLNQHQLTIHKIIKHSCPKCNIRLNSAREHMSKKHQENVFPCDQCGFRSDSIPNLDNHTEGSHPRNRNKNIDIRQLRNRSPCNFTDCSHSKDCCDRVPGPPVKYYTQKERLQNGPCRNWVESECSFYELCKYAHVPICHFQKQCRNSENCHYFHHDGSNQDFLGGRAYQKSFTLNLEEFPPLPS